MSDWTKDLFGKPVHDATLGDRLTGSSTGVRPGYAGDPFGIYSTPVRKATFGERMMGESQPVHYDSFGRPITWK